MDKPDVVVDGRRAKSVTLARHSTSLFLLVSGGGKETFPIRLTSGITSPSADELCGRPVAYNRKRDYHSIRGKSGAAS